MEHLEMDTDNLTLHSTYTKHFKQHTVHFTSHTARCKLYTVRCTLYTANLQCTQQV